MEAEAGTEIPFIIKLHSAITPSDYTRLDQIAEETWSSKDHNLVVARMRGPPCYLCGKRIISLHWFYAHICAQCGERSLSFRYAKKDLSGSRAVVTGGRVKLGYQIVLKLLRSGAEVLVTTRKWQDALARYRDEPDYFLWQDRLHILPLNFDLSNIDTLLPRLEAEIVRLWPDGGIDLLVNNAALTISGVEECDFRPAGAVGSFVAGQPEREDSDSRPETKDSDSRPETKDSDLHSRPGTRSKEHKSLESPDLSPSCYPPKEWVEKCFPQYDRYCRKRDVREVNTWGSTFGSVQIKEAKEVLLVNAWAPFVLTQAMFPRLKLRMVATSRRTYVIHVNAKEGSFSSHKTLCHTHTNMAKAALSMMNRCLAGQEFSPEYFEYFRSIWKETENIPWSEKTGTKKVSSSSPIDPATAQPRFHRDMENIITHNVDPGWFSVDEYPYETRLKKNIIVPPLDEVDGAARVLYPFFNEVPSFPGTWRHYIPVKDF